ncbi:hypothetical protein OsJ_06876 [Oryza sativa Japonica Group]|uniref:Uncharacterized protein n=1 Tax=Oryza sativa subsp. japonica TaxID=39947 RepID=A3A7A2_ORYSJ|nr:hypothetical protein OsJ_06876 [Oryza sativa Japonica Group]
MPPKGNMLGKNDVNFWGSVYPTYYALPHLKASKGKLVVSCSAAGTVGTSRMSFYNATKAAQLRFYETLRAELGSEVGITVLTPGYVESEITKGKGIQSGGDVAVNEEARDEQIGVFPVGRVAELGEGGHGRHPGPATAGSLPRPGVLDWACRALYGTRKGARPPLGKRIMEATGMKRLFPEALRRNPAIKTEDEEYCDGEEGYGAADDAAAAYLLQCRKGLRAAHTYIRCIFSLSDSIL